MFSKIIEQLKQERLKRRISQTEIADRIGIRQATLSGYECGHYVPPVKTLDDYAAAIGVYIRVEFVEAA